MTQTMDIWEDAWQCMVRYVDSIRNQAVNAKRDKSKGDIERAWLQGKADASRLILAEMYDLNDAIANSEGKQSR